MDNRYPGFYIVGAAKCGTTALSEYLGQHPNICFSKHKEPMYFGTDLEHHWRAKDEEHYLSNFAHAKQGQLKGEGSVWYLPSEKSAAEIAAVRPDAKIIILLRHPVSMAHSLHNQFLLSHNESVTSFTAAYNAQANRAEGRQLPPSPHFPEGLQYTKMASYSAQVQRYIDQFPADQLKIAIFEEFFKDLPKNYSDVLSFLGQDTSYAPDFKVVNPAKAPRNRRLGYALSKGWLSRRPDPNDNNPIRKQYHWRVKQARDILNPINTIEARPPKLNPELRNALFADFKDDVKNLEDVLKRDLSIWRPTP